MIGPGVLHRLRRVEVRRRGLDGVADPRGRAVRHPHDARRARLLPHRAAHAGVDELRRALDRRLRRAHRADRHRLERHERPAGRRPRQARQGAGPARQPGRAAAALGRRRRRRRGRRAEGQGPARPGRRPPRAVVLAGSRRRPQRRGALPVPQTPRRRSGFRKSEPYARATSCTAPATSAWRTCPTPTLRQPTDALVRVVRTCVCGSDLHPYHRCRARGRPRWATSSSASSRTPAPRSAP